MERTADRRTLHLWNDFHISTPSDTRSRPPSLILVSLDDIARARFDLRNGRRSALREWMRACG
jgi:hypothetical protein